MYIYINNVGKTMINNPLGKMVIWGIAYGIVLPDTTMDPPQTGMVTEILPISEGQEARALSDGATVDFSRKTTCKTTRKNGDFRGYSWYDYVCIYIYNQELTELT